MRPQTITRQLRQVPIHQSASCLDTELSAEVEAFERRKCDSRKIVGVRWYLIGVKSEAEEVVKVWFGKSPTSFVLTWRPSLKSHCGEAAARREFHAERSGRYLSSQPKCAVGYLFACTTCGRLHVNHRSASKSAPHPNQIKGAVGTDHAFFLTSYPHLDTRKDIHPAATSCCYALFERV